MYLKKEEDARVEGHAKHVQAASAPYQEYVNRTRRYQAAEESGNALALARSKNNPSWTELVSSSQHCNGPVVGLDASRFPCAQLTSLWLRRDMPRQNPAKPLLIVGEPRRSRKETLTAYAVIPCCAGKMQGKD